ncbi:MAG TPA: FKBP-type peptidyl-prolyl cis-trans isomerase [Herpetosiphonaceae bacterium]
MPNGVDSEDLRGGEGQIAARGDWVTVRYDGYVQQGDLFQTRVTCSFRLHRRDVIPGLVYGIASMRVGGRRRIRISPYLAYGATGVPGLIPPQAVLVFDLELLGVKAAG